MATFIRRATMTALVLIGLFAAHGTANAQFAFGWTRYGYNPSNPFVAQQQYLANLQANAYAIRAGAQVPAWLPYVAPYAAPAVFPPYINAGGYGYTAPLYNPYSYNSYSVNPYLGVYGNPYLSSNPYSAYGY
jgi:hypothetical protein